MNWLAKLEKIDRRWIFLGVALVVAAPLLLGLKTSVDITPPVKNTFEAIDRLPPGSVVMISIDYDASTMPENQPMLLAVLRHAFQKNLKIILMGHWPLGLPVGTLGLDQVAREMHKTYGVDYVNLGFRPGTAAVMVNLGTEFRNVFPSDYKGVPLDSLEMVKNVHNYNDIRLLVGIEAGDTYEFWIIYVQARFGLKMAMGTTAVMAPTAYKYLQSGQLVGLIGGLKGAAEYESLIAHPGIGLAGMPAQSAGHLLIILFIILGNIGFFLSRRKKA